MKATLKIPIYHGKLIIIQEDDLNKIAKQYELDTKPDEVDAFTFVLKDNVYTVFKDNTNAQIVAHEALHVVTYIFQDRGILIENRNDEPAAYLLGWVVKQITKRINIDNSKL